MSYLHVIAAPARVTTIEIVAHSAVDASLRRGADRKLANPYLIGLLLFRHDPWEVFERPLAGLRYIVTERLRVMRSLAGTHYYDANEMMGLREVELALSDDQAWATAVERRR